MARVSRVTLCHTFTVTKQLCVKFYRGSLGGREYPTRHTSMTFRGYVRWELYICLSGFAGVEAIEKFPTRQVSCLEIACDPSV